MGLGPPLDWHCHSCREARGHEAVVHDFIKDRRNSIELVLQVIQVADEVEAGYKVMQHR